MAYICQSGHDSVKDHVLPLLTWLLARVGGGVVCLEADINPGAALPAKCGVHTCVVLPAPGRLSQASVGAGIHIT